MGVRLIAKDVDAEAYATEYSAPVRRALEGIHFLNGSPQKAARNYAPGKISGAVVGLPTAFSDRLSTVGLVSYIQSSVAETDAMTIFCIARSGDANTSDATRPGFFGNYSYAGVAADGGAADGTVMYFRVAGGMAVAAGYGNTAADRIFPIASLPTTDAAKWALYVVIVSTAGITFRDVTNNRAITQTGTTGLPRRRAVNKFRLGSNYDRFGGICDMAVWQAHSAVLTEEEIATTTADLRAYAARKGITV